MTEQSLFEPEERLSSSAAWACNVYALVPYLGILFLPVAFVLAAFDFSRARRSSKQNDARLAIAAFVTSLFLLACQLLLWWLLYIIPEIGI